MQESAMEGAFLTVDELFNRWKRQVSKGTLANWRSKGIGPAYIKPGKAVLYPLAEIIRWECQQAGNGNTNTTPAI